MFDVGWSELLVIGVVAVVVVGPKDLPRMLRTFGNYAGKARRVANDFKRQFDEALREAELDDVRKSVDELSKSMSVDLNKPATAPMGNAPAQISPPPAPAEPATEVNPAEPVSVEPASMEQKP